MTRSSASYRSAVGCLVGALICAASAASVLYALVLVWGALS